MMGDTILSGGIEWGVLMVVVAYFLGSLPFGVILCRLLGHGDVRRAGSGNIGATNVWRVAGRYIALVTFLADAGKAYLAVKIVFWVGMMHDSPSSSPSSSDGDFAAIAALFDGHLAAIAALAALLGHMFPCWLRGRGGKGVAPTFGIWMAFDWGLAFLAGLVWLGVFAWKRMSSLASLVSVTLVAGLAVMPLLGGFLSIGSGGGGAARDFWLFSPFASPFMSQGIPPFLALSMAVLIWIRHADNIARLYHGREHRWNHPPDVPPDDNASPDVSPNSGAPPDASPDG